MRSLRLAAIVARANSRKRLDHFEGRPVSLGKIDIPGDVPVAHRRLAARTVIAGAIGNAFKGCDVQTVRLRRQSLQQFQLPLLSFLIIMDMILVLLLLKV